MPAGNGVHQRSFSSLTVLRTFMTLYVVSETVPANTMYANLVKNNISGVKKNERHAELIQLSSELFCSLFFVLFHRTFTPAEYAVFFLSLQLSCLDRLLFEVGAQNKALTPVSVLQQPTLSHIHGTYWSPIQVYVSTKKHVSTHRQDLCLLRLPRGHRKL